MGCDFWWTGAIPDPVQQVEVATLFRKVFDWSGHWTEVTPRPESRAQTLFGNSPYVSPVRDANFRDRIEEAHPENFFGVAPYLGRTADRRILHHGQFVFDRSDGGRFVSVMPVGELSDPGGLGDEGITQVVMPGGHVRLLGEVHCRALALFLNLVRLRYCPELEARDDRLYVERAAEGLEANGATEEVASPDFGFIGFLNKRLESSWSLLEPRRPTAPASELIVEDMVEFDFLPFLYAWRRWALSIDPEDSAEWTRFFLVYVPAIVKRSERTAPARVRTYPMLIRLRMALTDIWNEDGFAEIVEGGTKDGGLFLLHKAGGGDRATYVPLDLLEAALR